MNSIIVHYQEIALKGKNRPWFIERLVTNLRDATADIGITKVRALMGRIELSLGPEANWETVRDRVERIFGIANFSRAQSTGRDVDEISKSILRDLGHQQLNSDRTIKTFSVRAKRADKSFKLTSPEIEREVGGRVKQATGWNVDLTNPDVSVGIEVLPTVVFYSLGKEHGQGGLPTGTSGPVLCLLSGGIDSPVAAFRLMKRGCRVRFIHFHAYPILSHASQEKTEEIVGLLTRHQLRSRFHLVPFGKIQQQVVLSAPPALRIVIYRRLMMRISERFATACGAQALVTGEAVGQVASQTLENISAINEVVNMPVLRPLIGSDKEEITREARLLGTYPISIIPDQDCCTLFMPKNPATKARLADVRSAEDALPIAGMVDAAVERAESKEFVFP